MSVVLTHFPHFESASGKMFYRYSSKLEESLKQEVVKHFEQIFGKDVLIFRLTTRLSLPRVDRKVIPDDFALDLSNSLRPKLILIEYELAVHDIYEHISTQIMRFLDAIGPNQARLFEVLRNGCRNDEERLKLYDAIYKDSPVILVIIDTVTEKIKEKADRFNVRLLEFATYVEDLKLGFDSEHIHFFEPYSLKETELEKETETIVRSARIGEITSQSDYIFPILEALVEMGGSGRTSEILDMIFQKMKHTLKSKDFEKIPSGTDIRWKHTAQWARQRLVNEGHLNKDSARGTWEITGAGRRLYENLRSRR